MKKIPKKPNISFKKCKNEKHKKKKKKKMRTKKRVQKRVQQRVPKNVYKNALKKRVQKKCVKKHIQKTRPCDCSTRCRWTLCTHPPFLGLHACNKMDAWPMDGPVLLHARACLIPRKKSYMKRGHIYR